MSKVVDEIILMLATEHSSFHAASANEIRGNGIRIYDLGNVSWVLFYLTSIAKVTYKSTEVNMTTMDRIKLELATQRWYENASLKNYS